MRFVSGIFVVVVVIVVAAVTATTPALADSVNTDEAACGASSNIGDDCQFACNGSTNGCQGDDRDRCGTCDDVDAECCNGGGVCSPCTKRSCAHAHVCGEAGGWANPGTK